MNLAARLRLGGVDAPTPRLRLGRGRPARRPRGSARERGRRLRGDCVSAWEAGRIPLLPSPPPGLAAPPSPTLWDGVLMLTGGRILGAGSGAPASGRAARLPRPRPFPGHCRVVDRRVSHRAGADDARPAERPVRVLLNAVVVAALAAFHGDAPPLNPQPWLVAGGVGLALVPILATDGGPVPRPRDADRLAGDLLCGGRGDRPRPHGARWHHPVVDGLEPPRHRRVRPTPRFPPGLVASRRRVGPGRHDAGQ